MSPIPVRVGIVQRVLPAYRAAFFDALAAACTGGLSVFAGQPRSQEMIASGADLHVAHHAPADNRHLLGGAAYLCYQRGLLRWLADWQPQVLILEANPRYLSSPAAVQWMKKQGSGVIGWGLGAPVLGGGVRQWLRRRFLSQFDALIAYSQSGRSQYVSLGLPPERIFVAPNAVAPRPTHPLPDRAAPAAPLTVLFVGRLQARKRIDLLLQACAALPESLRPRLQIAGPSPTIWRRGRRWKPWQHRFTLPLLFWAPATAPNWLPFSAPPISWCCPAPVASRFRKPCPLVCR